MQTISLLVLIVAISIGFWKNINVGIVSLALGFILTAAMGISVKVLVAGFPTKLFLTLLGTMPEDGQAAPDATLLDIDLNAVTISSLKGKVVLIAAVPSLHTATE